MYRHKNKVILDKEEFVANSLAMGIAVQILASKSEISMQEWSIYLTNAAEEQLQKLTPKQIDEMVDVYVKVNEEINE